MLARVIRGRLPVLRDRGDRSPAIAFAGGDPDERAGGFVGHRFPLKVVLISRYAPPGRLHHGRGLNFYAKSLATALARAGVEVTVLADRIDGHDERYVEDGVHVHRVWTIGSPDVGRLVSEIDRLRPSIVHVQYELFMFGPGPSALAPPALARRLQASTRVVTTVHGVIPTADFRALSSAYARRIPPEAVRRIYASIVRRVIGASHLVIAHNWSLLTSVNSYGVPSAARVVPLGIDGRGLRRDRSEALTHFGLPDRRRAVFFGFLLPYKGLDTLRRAAPLLAAHDVEVLVAGGSSGDPRSTFSPSRASGDPGAVTQLGYVDEEAIPDLFALADVLVLPYRFGLAGSGPLSLAATHRTPVVVSDVPALAETVGVPAATFPRGDHVALADAVVRVLDDTEVRSRVLKRLDELVHEHSWEKVADATIEAYESLLPAGV